MKSFKSIILIISFLSVLISCEEDEVYTGSPVDNSNIEIVTLTAQVSTTATSALTDQKIPFTVTLPRTFNSIVKVEATTLSDAGGRRRAYVEVPANSTTATGEILAAGGAIFNSTFTLALTAIELTEVEQGKHYLLNSNVVSINTGNTTIPDEDASRLQIKFTWIDASSSTNNLKLVIDRPGTVADALPTLTGSSRFHYISNVDAVSPNSNGTSNIAGDYILQFNAIKLISTPNSTNMPYRIILNYPNGKVEVYEGVYNNLFANDPATSENEESPLLPVLKITETVTDGVVSFSALQL